MFYPTELLSFRRKSNITRCWLAATISEKRFKRICRSSQIISVNVSSLCEEIMATIELRNNAKYGRFSLYLSSQLMYGATKLLLYQTVIFQASLREVNTRLDAYRTAERREAFVEVRRILDVPEVPPLNVVFEGLVLPPDMHLLEDPPLVSAMKNMMRSENRLNFGAMLAEDLDILFSEIEITPRFVSPNGAQLDNADKTIQEVPEVELELAKEGPIESVVAIEVPHVEDQTVPETPTKRKLSPPKETPTKKKKLTYAEETAEVPVAEEEEFVVPEMTRKIQRGIRVDAQCKLTMNRMRKGIENVRCNTREQSTPAPYFPLAKELFRLPSITMHAKNSKLWAKPLISLYTKNLMYNAESDPDIEEVRANTTEGLIDHVTAEMSSKIDINLTTKTMEKSKIVDSILPGVPEELNAVPLNDPSAMEHEMTSVELPEVPLHEPSVMKHEGTSVQLPEINGIDEQNSGNRVLVTKRELRTFLEMGWQEAESLKVHNVISPETYNRMDAANMFRHLLELHTHKKIILQQAKPFGTIHVSKYPNFSSDSSNDKTS